MTILKVRLVLSVFKNSGLFCALALSAFLLLLIRMKISPSLFSFDRKLTDFILFFKGPFWDAVLLPVTQIGDSTSLISISAIIVIFLLMKRLWRTAIFCLCGFLGSTLCVGYIKVFVGRARPINDLYSGSESFSFPSGHMTNTTVVIGTLGILTALSLSGKWRVFTAAVTASIFTLMGISRIYLGAHWPSDILGGLLFGISLALLIQILIDKFDPQSRARMSAQNFAVLWGLALAIWIIHLSTNGSLPAYQI